MIGLVAVTAAGRSAARRLAGVWAEARIYDGPVAEALPRAFAECDAVVAFLATGATVRLLAPLLGDKQTDPGVVCVDETLRHAVALVGGHAGGANELARRVGEVLGCEPVVTTASDAAGVPALDEIAATMGWVIEPGGDVPAVGAALLSGERVTLVSDRVWPLPALPDNVVAAPGPESGTPAIIVSDLLTVPAPSRDGRPFPLGGDNRPTAEAAQVSPSPSRGDNRPLPRGRDNRPSAAGTPGRTAVPEAGERGSAVVVLRPASLVVGVGASRGVGAEEVLGLVDAALADAGLAPLAVRHLATVEAKAGEAGLLDAAHQRGWAIQFHPAEALREVETPNPSPVVMSEIGSPSVAEAAALIGGRAELVVEKRKSPKATVAVARHEPRGRLAIVGLGPGARDLLAPRGLAELRRCSVLVGLDQYVESVRDLVRPGTRVLASGLGDEEARARRAVDEARRGHAVALVGSGDAGVYALAGPALGFATGDIDVTGVPGITAALAASTLLGAPLGHDHAYISLSDLHTPWEAIERRVRAAAEGDFVVCLYNPRSRARDWQLGKALAMLAEHRPPTTPVGLVRNASRPGERVTLTTLGEFGAEPQEAVDMYTVVIVGSSNTAVVAGRMVTPRGYRWAR